MKKILVASLFAASAAMGLSSCMNGDYDANPLTNNTTKNPLDTMPAGNVYLFDWNGTAPMSATIEGNPWHASTGTYTPPMGGMPASVTAMGPGNSAISVMFPETAPPNTVIDFDAMNVGSYTPDFNNTDPNQKFNAHMGGGGSLQILENDASHVMGKFQFNASNSLGQNVQVSEGYFEVTK